MGDSLPSWVRLLASARVDPRANSLASALRLEPHPEGGFFREIHRSPTTVETNDGRGSRAAMTVIYFLLTRGDHSRWHVVASDEQWTFLEGDPLELLVVSSEADQFSTLRLGPMGAGHDPTTIVPGGAWQAARSAGAFSLMTCTVGPGFDYADFRFLADDPADSERIRRDWPRLAGLL